MSTLYHVTDSLPLEKLKAKQAMVTGLPNSTTNSSVSGDMDTTGSAERETSCKVISAIIQCYTVLTVNAIKIAWRAPYTTRETCPCEVVSIAISTFKCHSLSSTSRRPIMDTE